MKKIVFGFVFAFFAAFGLSAQQITRFGVVDTARVYQAYFRNSAPVRNYESKKAEFQTEINKRTEEIQNLNIKMPTFERKIKVTERSVKEDYSEIQPELQKEQAKELKKVIV